MGMMSTRRISVYLQKKKKKKTFATYSSISTLNPILGIPYPFFYGTVRQKKKLIVRFRDPKKSREPEQHYVADI